MLNSQRKRFLKVIFLYRHGIKFIWYNVLGKRLNLYMLQIIIFM